MTKDETLDEIAHAIEIGIGRPTRDFMEAVCPMLDDLDNFDQVASALEDFAVAITGLVIDSLSDAGVQFHGSAS